MLHTQKYFTLPTYAFDRYFHISHLERENADRDFVVEDEERRSSILPPEFYWFALFAINSSASNESRRVVVKEGLNLKNMLKFYEVENAIIFIIFWNSKKFLKNSHWDTKFPLSNLLHCWCLWGNSFITFST
jgi:hypothetical protein